MVICIRSTKLCRQHHYAHKQRQRLDLVCLIHLVDEGGGAGDELDVVAVEDDLVLDLLRPQDRHTIKHVNFPYLFKERDNLSTFHT